jgi:hypothetical protein
VEINYTETIPSVNGAFSWKTADTRQDGTTLSLMDKYPNTPTDVTIIILIVSV